MTAPLSSGHQAGPLTTLGLLLLATATRLIHEQHTRHVVRCQRYALCCGYTGGTPPKHMPMYAKQRGSQTNMHNRLQVRGTSRKGCMTAATHCTHNMVLTRGISIHLQHDLLMLLQYGCAVERACLECRKHLIQLLRTCTAHSRTSAPSAAVTWQKG
jgi:hypothetical protein